jgi:hypothetical protein
MGEGNMKEEEFRWTPLTKPKKSRTWLIIGVVVVLAGPVLSRDGASHRSAQESSGPSAQRFLFK